jgi:quercetin dioxygenase-like cupin family protein
MSEHDVRPICLAPGEGVTVKNPTGGRTDGPLTFKVRGAESNGVLTVLESSPAPGEGPPLHVHVGADEVLYVLEGRLRIMLEDEVRDAPAGTCAFIPRGVSHTWQNVGDAPARFLAVLTPSGLERFFERFAQLPEDASILEAFRTIGPEAGMEVVGPPLAHSDPL